MGLFGFGKKKGILDLTERYKEQQEKIDQQSEDQESSQSPSNNAFSFLGSLASSSGSSSETSNDYVDVSGADEKRKKLAKRLMDMTTKIEDLSNQIYHLQQRIEVLEKKGGVGGY